MLNLATLVVGPTHLDLHASPATNQYSNLGRFANLSERQSPWLYKVDDFYHLQGNAAAIQTGLRASPSRSFPQLSPQHGGYEMLVELCTTANLTSLKSEDPEESRPPNFHLLQSVFSTPTTYTFHLGAAPDIYEVCVRRIPDCCSLQS